MKKIIILIVILAGCHLELPGTARATEFHVSLKGSDSNSGTAQQPFRTLERARDAVRTWKAGGRKSEGGVTVWVHGGTYYLDQPFTLTEEDSGSSDAPIVYRAREGEDVWLSGGRPIPLSAFQPVSDAAVLSRLVPDARGKVLRVSLKGLGIEGYAPSWPDHWWQMRRDKISLLELFADGRRLPLARWPNVGYTQFGDIIEAAKEEDKLPKFAYEGKRPERWNVAEGVWLYGYWRRAYRAEFLKVKAIDREERTIELTGRHSLGDLEDGGARRYMAINLLEELDQAGEWYLDRKRALLYLWPPDDLDKQELTLSMVEPALIQCVKTSYVEFHSLGLEASRQDGIRIEGGNGCRVVGSEIRNVGRLGVYMDGDAHALVGSDIHDTGSIAVSIRGGDRRTLTGGGVIVDNNHIHHANRIARAGLMAVEIGGVGHHLAHNLIHDTGYIAVSFSGNDHVIEFNRLFRTNTEAIEGGVFYTGRDWTSRGTVIRYNFVHQIEDTQEGCGSATRFIHLDDSAPGIEIYGNVCYRLGGGVSICGGADNNVHDNLFVECLWAADISPRAKDMFSSDGKGGFRMNPNRWNWTSLVKRLERYDWREPPYITKYPRLKEIFLKDPIAAPWYNVISRNVTVDSGRSVASRAMKAEWATIKDNWEESDPGFVEQDRTKLDFRLKPDAKIYAMGFGHIPFEKIGLYQSPERRSWPVKLDLPPPDWKPRWMHLKEAAAKSPTALPVFRAMRMTGKIVIDGAVDPMEWTPGDATGVNPEIHETAFLEWDSNKAKALHPSQALLEVDDTNLYVGFRNESDPTSKASGGHVWIKDDAVEISIAEVKDKIGDIIVLRGYADGHWESSDKAGARKAAVQQSRQGVQYAAKAADKGSWSAEWKIPFSALGIEPGTHNPKLLFNLSVHKPADKQWVMLKKSGGSSWDLSKAGFLWLAPFGDVVFDAGVPSRARIDIDSSHQPIMLTPGKGCVVGEWAAPRGCYLTGETEPLPSEKWSEMVYEFTPQADGTVTLKLMGNAMEDPGSGKFTPVWSYFDDITVEGAELENGSFEVAGKKGLPAGWRYDVGKAYWIHDPKLAASGEYLVKVWHSGRFSQQLKVVKGHKVVIRAKVRGSGGAP